MTPTPEWTDEAIAALVAECEEREGYLGAMDIATLVSALTSDRSHLLSALRSLRERVRLTHDEEIAMQWADREGQHLQWYGARVRVLAKAISRLTGRTP